MKRLYFSLLTIAILSLIIVHSCSSEEDDTTAPNVVQTPEPEPPAPTQYSLTVTAGEGGTVSTEGGRYDEGTEVTITVSANEGYRFTGWEGNDSTSESLTITLNSNQSFQALFELIPPVQYTLIVTTSEGGTISSEGGQYEEGTTVTITATPDDGYEFSGWTGTSQISSEIMITISSDLNLTAVFNEIKPVSIVWTSNNCPWKANYEFKDSKIYISSEQTANNAGLNSLSIILKPTIEGKKYDKITYETLGFDLHEYVESELELNSQNILFEIPEAKSAFRMDLEITVRGVYNGLECICVLDEDFSRPDDLYPNSNIEIPSNAIPDFNKFQSYRDKIPLPNAQSVFLSTTGADWFDGNGTWRDEKVRKPDVPIRLALFGKDVYPEDWETLRDILEILNLIAPNLDIAYASNIEEITLPIHMLNCDTTLNSYNDCKLSGPFGYFSNFPEYPQDRLYKNNPWGFIQVSNQGVNRHTLTHEIGHALGLFHWNIGGASMGYYFDQAPYLSKWDLMAISTIDNILVKN